MSRKNRATIKNINKRKRDRKLIFVIRHELASVYVCVRVFIAITLTRRLVEFQFHCWILVSFSNGKLDFKSFGLQSGDFKMSVPVWCIWFVFAIQRMGASAHIPPQNVHLKRKKTECFQNSTKFKINMSLPWAWFGFNSRNMDRDGKKSHKKHKLRP